MKAIGRKTSSTDKDLRPGLMEQVTTETMLKARSTAVESSLGLMAAPTPDNSMRTTSKERVSIHRMNFFLGIYEWSDGRKF